MADRTDNASKPDPNERPLGELFADLADDLGLLIRQEVALAKSEIGHEISKAVGGASSVVYGGFIAIAGVFVLYAALILLLALVVPTWASALIIGGIFFLIGLILAIRGWADIKKMDLTPKRTVRTLGEDAKEVTERLR